MVPSRCLGVFRPFVLCAIDHSRFRHRARRSSGVGAAGRCPRATPRAHVRLLTLTGTGGTGKTRLALAVAGEMRDDFRDGVWLVDLALVHDVALVIRSIAQTLGVKEQPHEPLLTTLAASLQDQSALLVLDNFEQVVGAAPDVASLLDASPALKLVVTSRTALRVYGEHQYQVPPLSDSEAESAIPPARAGRLCSVCSIRRRCGGHRRDLCAPGWPATGHRARGRARPAPAADGAAGQTQSRPQRAEQPRAERT